MHYMPSIALFLPTNTSTHNFRQSFNLHFFSISIAFTSSSYISNLVPIQKLKWLALLQFGIQTFQRRLVFERAKFSPNFVPQCLVRYLDFVQCLITPFPRTTQNHLFSRSLPKFACKFYTLFSCPAQLRPSEQGNKHEELKRKDQR